MTSVLCWILRGSGSLDLCCSRVKIEFFARRVGAMPSQAAANTTVRLSDCYTKKVSSYHRLILGESGKPRNHFYPLQNSATLLYSCALHDTTRAAVRVAVRPLILFRLIVFVVVVCILLCGLPAFDLDGNVHTFGHGHRAAMRAHAPVLLLAVVFQLQWEPVCVPSEDRPKTQIVGDPARGEMCLCLSRRPPPSV